MTGRETSMTDRQPDQMSVVESESRGSNSPEPPEESKAPAITVGDADPEGDYIEQTKRKASLLQFSGRPSIVGTSVSGLGGALSPRVDSDPSTAMSDIGRQAATLSDLGVAAKKPLSRRNSVA